eukprot:scaffold441429_cov20-Prasinocladus_malaysianus.AAC.2
MSIKKSQKKVKYKQSLHNTSFRRKALLTPSKRLEGDASIKACYKSWAQALLPRDRCRLVKAVSVKKLIDKAELALCEIARPGIGVKFIDSIDYGLRLTMLAQ